MTNSIMALLCVCLLAGCDRATIVDQANRDGIMLVGNSAEPKGLDSQLISGVPESKILTSLFEGLCGDHPSEDNTMAPGAAIRWQHNEDMTVWTFHLQPNGKWSDGEAVDTDDFLFSYHRILNPRFAAPYAAMLHSIKNAKAYNEDQRGYILCGLDPSFPAPWEQLKVVNFRGDPKVDTEVLKNRDYDSLDRSEKKTWIAGRGLDRLKKPALMEILSDKSLFAWPESIETDTRDLIIRRLVGYIEANEFDLYEQAQIGLHAPDKHTLVVTLREPVPYLPAMTRHTSWFPVPKHVVLKHGLMTDRFTEWSELENIVGNGPFQLKAWRFNHYIEVERNPHYWDAGNVGLNGIRFFPIVDFYTETRAFLAGQLHTAYSLPSELLEWAKTHHSQYLRVEPYVGTRYIRFNTRKAGLNKLKVRKALSLALNREELCKYIFEGYKPATALTPKVGNYTPPDVLEFHMGKAKQLLAEAGHPNGDGLPRYKILTTRINPSVEAVQAAFRELGIGTDVELKTFGPYVTAQQDGLYDISMAGWIGDYPDPTTFLDMWTRGNGNNNTGWSSEEYEALLRQAAQQSDPDERVKILAKAEKILLDDAPIAPLAWYTRLYFHRPEVKGWYPLLLDNHPWKHITLEVGE
ncbi:MAG: peptide ABC transporter substrate-binding protein [Luteolibacter sp.]